MVTKQAGEDSECESEMALDFTGGHLDMELPILDLVKEDTPV